MHLELPRWLQSHTFNTHTNGCLHHMTAARRFRSVDKESRRCQNNLTKLTVKIKNIKLTFLSFFIFLKPPFLPPPRPPPLHVTETPRPPQPARLQQPHKRQWKYKNSTNTVKIVDNLKSTYLVREKPNCHCCRLRTGVVVALASSQ